MNNNINPKSFDFKENHLIPTVSIKNINIQLTINLIRLNSNIILGLLQPTQLIATQFQAENTIGIMIPIIKGDNIDKFPLIQINPPINEINVTLAKNEVRDRERWMSTDKRLEDRRQDVRKLYDLVQNKKN